VAEGTGKAAQTHKRVTQEDMRDAGKRDRADVERQIGRPPRAFRRVVVRCPFGRPAVTEQAPYDAGGRPFPTTYYLTCPHAVAVVARAEAAGGVERWSDRVVAEPELGASLQRATAHQRRLRQELAGGKTGPDSGASLDLGIAGSATLNALKCLHAHIAFALAEPGYELGAAMIAALPEPLFPSNDCCIAGRGAAPRSL
jgi:hypothetical protein